MWFPPINIADIAGRRLWAIAQFLGLAEYVTPEGVAKGGFLFRSGASLFLLSCENVAKAGGGATMAALSFEDVTNQNPQPLVIEELRAIAESHEAARAATAGDPLEREYPALYALMRDRSTGTVPAGTMDAAYAEFDALMRG